MPKNAWKKKGVCWMRNSKFSRVIVALALVSIFAFGTVFVPDSISIASNQTVNSDQPGPW